MHTHRIGTREPMPDELREPAREREAALRALGEYAYGRAAWSSVPTMIRAALVKAGAEEASAEQVADAMRDAIRASGSAVVREDES